MYLKWVFKVQLRMVFVHFITLEDMDEFDLYKILFKMWKKASHFGQIPNTETSVSVLFYGKLQSQEQNCTVVEYCLSHAPHIIKYIYHITPEDNAFLPLQISCILNIYGCEEQSISLITSRQFCFQP